MSSFAHKEVTVEASILLLFGFLDSPELTKQSRLLYAQEVVLDSLFEEGRSQQYLLVLADPPRVDYLASEQRQQFELTLCSQTLAEVQLHGS